MSMTDQARSYLALREQITRLREEHGDDMAWRIVEAAVRANITSEKIVIHKVLKPQLKQWLQSQNAGEIA